MSAESILKEFQRRRRLIEHLSAAEADARLTAFLHFLNSHSETKDIIQDVTSKFPVYDLIRGCSEGKPPHAGKLEEIVSVGLYLMDECSNGKHLYDVARKLGMYPSTKSRTQAKPQDYVDEAEYRYITPALDFIEDKLTEVTTGEQKSDKGKVTGEIKMGARAAAKVVKAKKNDVESLDKTTDEPTLEEASIGAYSVPDQATRYDALGFEPYTTAIAEFLGHENTKPPLTLSIEGEWGSGKSSFMLQLTEKLKKEDALIVKFSPWRHEKEESVWAAFVLTFSEQLAEELGFFNSIKSYYKLLWERFNWREGWPELIKFAIKCFAYFIILIGVIIVLWAGWIPYIEDVSRKVFVSIFGAAAVIWQVLKKSSEVIGNPFKHDLKKYIQTPDYTSRIPFIEKFHKDFKKIVETYAGDKRVYVFIDDLDRCEVPKATDLMQAINLMISDDPQLVFIVGMDRQKVAAGLAVKHKELFQYLYPPRIGDGAGQLAGTDYMSGLRYGYSFIEKFIQLPFRVPRPTASDIETLMDKIQVTVTKKKAQSLHEKQTSGTIRTTGNNEGAKEDLEEEQIKEQRKEMLRLKFEEDSQKVSEIVLMVAPALDYNPRRIKQFINLFRLRAYIARETGLFYQPEGKTQFKCLTLEQLGKFVAIIIKWPSFVTDLNKDHDLLNKLTKVSEEDVENESEYVQRWFQEKTLMSLIEYCPQEEGEESEDLEWPKYTLMNLDVTKLLEISPKVSRVEIPPEKETLTTKEKYKAFYSELLDRFKKEHPEITRRKALPQSWLTLPIGHAYIHLEWAFHGRPRSRFEVGLHFEKAKKEENEKLIKYFRSIRDELEEELGGIKLEFQTDWGARWARIYTSKQEGKMTDELKDWAVETALKFYDVFKPRLDKFIRSKKGGRVTERLDSMKWYKVKMSADEVTAKGIVKLQDKFMKLFLGARKQEDMALFSSLSLRSEDAEDGGVEIYFSPGSVSYAKELIDSYNGQPCEKPTKGKVGLLVGVSNAIDLLL